MLLTIVEEEEVSRAIDQKKLDFPRLDDAYEALKFRIARKPSSGYKIGNFYLLSTSENFVSEGLPRVLVLYKYDENEATIIDIKIESISS